MWDRTDGKRVWSGSKSDFAEAAAAAADCSSFSPDCEEECVADEAVSCYNCRYRRWTRESFMCMQESKT